MQWCGLEHILLAWFMFFKRASAGVKWGYTWIVCSQMWTYWWTNNDNSAIRFSQQANWKHCIDFIQKKVTQSVVIIGVRFTCVLYSTEHLRFVRKSIVFFKKGIRFRTVSVYNLYSCCFLGLHMWEIVCKKRILFCHCFRESL